VKNMRGALPAQERATHKMNSHQVTTTDPNGSKSESGAETSRLLDVVNSGLIREWAGSTLQAEGLIPLPGTAAWAALPNDDVRKRAAVIYAAIWWCEQHTAEALVQRADREDLFSRLDEKQFAASFSASRDWGSCRSWQELQQRRTTYTGRTIDPEAVARWVRTGSSEPQEVAA
jgi:hypothetical protein